MDKVLACCPYAPVSSLLSSGEESGDQVSHPDEVLKHEMHGRQKCQIIVSAQ